MHKNITKMFLLTTILILIVGLNTITATDNQTNTQIINKEISTNTPTKTIENKNTITTKNIKEKTTTELTIKFENKEEDEISTDNYKITRPYEEYTINITLKDEQKNTPIPETIQLYLQEDAQPIPIKLDPNKPTQKTYTTTNIGFNIIRAEYEGNENYYPATSEEIYLSIEADTPTITIDKIENPCYNSTIKITGTLLNKTKPMSNENITISFNNNIITTTQTNTNGKYTYEYNIENIPIQKGAIIRTDYQSNYEELTDTYEIQLIDIEKIKNNIQISNIPDTIIPNSIIINTTITDENNKKYNGKLNINITEKETNKTVYTNTVMVEKGKYDMNFTPEESGILELTIQTLEDDYYIATQKTTTFNIIKATPTLNIKDTYESKVGENISITGQLTNQYNQPLQDIPITISTSNELLQTITTDKNGYFNYTEYTYNEATNENSILYFNINENNKCHTIQAQANHLIKQRNTQTTLIADKKIKINTTLHIQGQVSDENNKNTPQGSITIYIEDKPIQENIPVNNGTYNADINIQDDFIGKDKLQVTVVFNPNNPLTYYESRKSTIIKQEKLDTYITIDTNNTKVNEPLNIRVTLHDENNNIIQGNVTIRINDENNKTVFNQTVSDNPITFTPTKSGTYYIITQFKDTPKYHTTSNNTQITVSKHDTTIKINNIPSTKYNTTILIKGQVTNQESNNPANGTVTININDNQVSTVNLTNGEYEYEYKPLTVQNNKLTIKFNANDAYNESEEITYFKTTKIETKITLDKINNTTINKNITITGTVTDENDNQINGTANILINNITIGNVKVENGLFKLVYKTSNIGLNNIQINYTPIEYYYHESTVYTTFNVTRNNLEIINLQNKVNDKEKTIEITGQLTDNNQPVEDIQVEMTVNNKTYSAITNNDGTFKIITDKLQPNNYSIKLTVNQTGAYNSMEKDLVNTIINTNPRIIIEKINATFSRKTIIQGNITDEYNQLLKNQPLIIRIENKEYYLKTDDKGQYKLQFTPEKTGTYKLNIEVPETENTNKTILNTTFNTKKEEAQIILETPEKVNPGQTLTLQGQLITQNEKLPYKNITITINNKTNTITTNNEGKFKYELHNILEGTYNITIDFQDTNYNTKSITTKYIVNKLEVKLTLDDIIARVGEQITFHATITDNQGNPVNGGNLVFKLNGRTLRQDNRFDTNNTNEIKFNVNEGTVTYTLTADLYLRNGKNISASYSGSYKYLSTKSETAIAKIQLRYANINVTTNTTLVKHHENITFQATLEDVTPKTNNNMINNETSVFFKINGVTIKDKQNNIIKSKVENGTAILNYNIQTMAGLDKNNKFRNYTLTAVYDSPYYYPINNRNTTVFNVERSKVNINIIKAEVQKNMLSLNLKLTDYLGYNIVGNSKLCVKINGVTYKEGNVSKIYTVENGILNVKLNVTDMKVKSLEIVTGQRLAYLSARQSTTKIVY